MSNPLGIDVVAALGKHSTVIDGVCYQTKAWPALRALAMAAQIGDVFGQAGLALLLRGMGGLKDAEEIEKKTGLDKAGEVAAAVGLGEGKGLLGAPQGRSGINGAYLLYQAAQPAKVAELMRECFREVVADKVQLGTQTVAGSVHEHFDAHFTGRMGHLFEVFSWVVRVSFSQPGSAGI